MFLVMAATSRCSLATGVNPPPPRRLIRLFLDPLLQSPSELNEGQPVDLGQSAHMQKVGSPAAYLDGGDIGLGSLHARRCFGLG